MGGSSSERDVSIKTGKAVITSLSKQYEVEPVDILFDGSDFPFLDKVQKGDVVFNALHGGSGENGDIQSLLDMRGISYTGSGPSASRICMDKHISKLIAQNEGVKVPDWFVHKNTMSYDRILLNDSLLKAEKIFYPCIVKPNNEGSTMGLAKVDSKEELDFAIDRVMKFSTEVMIEEHVSGREITVGVLGFSEGSKVLPIIEIFPKKDIFDYECKYSEGMSTYEVPAKIDQDLASRIHKDAIKIHESIGCRHYSRVDFILGDNNDYYFLEINSLPGMTSTSLLPMAAKSAGMNFDELIETILNMAIHQ